MQDEQLIMLVAAQPALYAKHNPLYTNGPMKRKVWAVIAKAMGSNMHLCMKRWVQLRERYCKEMRLAKAASDSGATAETRWPHFEAMTFLNPYIVTRTPNTNICGSMESVVVKQIVVELSPASSHRATPISTAANSPACSLVGGKRKWSDSDVAFMESAKSIKKLCDRQSDEVAIPALKSFANMLVTYLAKLPDSVQLQLISSITQQVAEVIDDYE